MEEEIKILPINPDTFEIQEYNSSDRDLLTLSVLDTTFSQSSDYIELTVYDENQNLIQEINNLTTYTVKQGDVLLNPEKDLIDLGLDIDSYFSNYTFYRKRLDSSPTEKYYISNISSNRTEIELSSNQIVEEDVIFSTNEFIQYRENANYFVDFYLNFGDNQTIVANNIKLSNEKVLIKLYDQLPSNFDIKSQLWVVEEISIPQAYKITFPSNIEIPNDFAYIQGPNFNLKEETPKGSSGTSFSYSELTNTPLTSSYNEIQNLLNQKEIEINIDYENFGEFTHFSSAKTRLENFYYKVGLIESSSNEISSFLEQITGGTLDTIAYSESKATLTNQIENVIQNFDGYERFLYYNSGSLYSYPKSNDAPPYNLYSTGSTEVLDWVGSADPDSLYYGGIALSASNYDQDNKDWLYWVVPQYLRDDPENAQYELFVDMVGQHYDNIWVYIKDVSKKFNADNRLQYGVSKDLVAQAIRDFNVKLYANNFNRDELYTAFLGLTPSGSLFPFPDITGSVVDLSGSLDIPSGFEYVDTKISSSNDAIPLDDVNKRLYKRIYHNIPYLLKTKGTHNGLRALLTSYGIPDTILRIDEFGGSKRHTTVDRNLEEKKFNYTYNLKDESTNPYFKSPWVLNSDWGAINNVPNTVQWRFKTPGIPNTSSFQNAGSYSQSFWNLDSLTPGVVLEYTGSAYTSGSYNGSVVNPENTYATLKFFPDRSDQSISASLYLPFFDGGWWSVMTTQDGTNASIYAANSIDGKLKFTGSDTVTGYDDSTYNSGSVINFSIPAGSLGVGGKSHGPFSGSLQEIRYFVPTISESAFHDYTLNPYSFEGNTINSAPTELAFRADLGTQLNTENRTSIHPKVTGSANYPTSSFAASSDYELFAQGNPSNTSSFSTNKESIYLNALATGIKDRATVKVALKDNILPAGPSGSNTSITVLSPLQSLQQTSPTTESFTDEINYVDISLSPQNQINDDIIAQLGNFNIGDYIGDPRQIYSASLNYPDLDTLRDEYFEKYIKNYDLKDFVRLIKYFDNSLFKMIDDFTPARTSLTSGVTIKQHILERNRSPFIQVGSSNLTLSGSIKSQARDYNTGSGDVGAYEYTSGSSIYRFSGGTGGSFERYNNKTADPYYQSISQSNNFFLTQSYSESIQGSVNSTGLFPNYSSKITSDQREFYDGEFSGSHIVVTTQSLNPGCAPYLKVVDTPANFEPLFFTSNKVTQPEFIKNTNSPAPGDAWIYHDNSLVKYIKLSITDIDGNSVKKYLQSSNLIEINFSDFNVGGRTTAEYYISGVTPFVNSVLLTIDQTKGDVTTTSSIDGGSEDWSLIARGNYSTEGANDNESQGTFKNQTLTNQSQVFTYWDGVIDDTLGVFNTGSISITNADIQGGISSSFGGYSPPRTSNIPWFFSCSLEYSASGGGNVTGITSSGIFHSASSYSGAGLTNQSFTLVNGGDSGIYVPSPKITDLSSIYFTSSYNTQIPGNSGSGFPLGGHPQIKDGGTGSIDFYFPSLTLSGSDIPITTANPTPFSGSVLNTNLPNGNFDIRDGFPGTNVLILPSSTNTRDGVIIFDEGEAEGYHSTHADGYPGEPLSIPSNVTFISGVVDFNFSFSASSDLNASASYQYGESSSFVNNTQTTRINYNTGSNGTWDFDENKNATFNASTDGSDAVLFRPIVKSPENNFEYYFGTASIEVTAEFEVEYTLEDSIVSQSEETTFTINFSSPFQSGITTPNQFTSSLATPASSKINIQANLKITGSEGERLVTSSLPLTSQDIYPGATFTFSDSPFLNITESTETITGDMYFIEYSMSNFVDNGDDVVVDFIESGDLGSKILISQSIGVESVGYNLTASFSVQKYNSDTGQFISGYILTSDNFSSSDSEATGSISATGSFNGTFESNDTFRLIATVNKNLGSELTITEYTMGIFPSSSNLVEITSSDSPGYGIFRDPVDTNFIIPTYFGGNVLPFEKALDCQPLLNNYEDSRENSYLMDVDYSFSSGSQNPQNFSEILNNTATRAQTPDSNYTNTGIINSKYNGAKSTSQKLNIWTPTDIGTYGKSPTVESRNAFFAYYNSIENYYPLLNDTVGLYLNYLIDKEGNAIPPSLEGDIFQTTIKNTFNTSGKVNLSLLTGSKNLQILNDEFSLVKLGTIPVPILYSQNGGQSYSVDLPLTSSRRISLYDEGDINSFNNYGFVANGTSSLGYSSTPTFNTILDPTQEVTQGAYASTVADDIIAYSSSGVDDGVIHFPIDPLTPGNDELSQEYIVSLDTLVDTSFTFESGEIEFEFKLALEYDDTGNNFAGSEVNIPPTIEDIELYVYEGGESKLVGSVAFGEDDVVRYITGKLTRNTKRQKRKYGLNKKDRRIGSEAPIVNKNNEIEFVVENYAVKEVLKANGFNSDYPSYTLQWRITANSGVNKFKEEDALRWRLSGLSTGTTNTFFPSGGGGKALPTKIRMIGNKSHLYANDNTGSAPYWAFTGSAGPLPHTIVSSSVLVMSSSNINEAYGNDSFQGKLDYTPGATPNFPGGVEPIGTQFPEVYYPLVLYPGDEIRFGNNENQSYRISKVTPPQENVEGDGKGRLKIELDGDVPASVLKDFFLVRRYIPNANSMILDAQFPYLTDGSGSNSTGLAFPPFPAIGLEASASAIIVDLTSKGVIN